MLQKEKFSILILYADIYQTNIDKISHVTVILWTISYYFLG